MSQQTISGMSPKRKRGRPKKTDEMPKNERVGRSHSRVYSHRKSRNLNSSLGDLENSYPREQLFSINEIKNILRNIGESFVKWIIEGVQTVEKETVLEASHRIQSIKSLLHERKSSIEKSRSVRQRNTVDLIDPLLNSADYLTMVIDNYLQNIVQKDQEANGNDLSFSDMFQDNTADTESYSFCEQNSTTKKSILKTQNINTHIKRKKISFAEKATKVYQDDETSQISVKKSSQRVKQSCEGNSESTNTTPENIQARLLLQPNKRPGQKTELMKLSPHETSLADESPSIIESSFLNDSFSSFPVNSSKNLKKFKSKTKNKKEIETPDDKANQFTKSSSTFDIFQANSKGSSQNVEGIEKEKSGYCNTYDNQSNIFSDELLKTFMSQIIGNEAEGSAPKTSENVSLPFHDFVLTLPESSASEGSLDASIRIAVSMAKGSVQNSKDISPKNSQISKAGEWTCRPDNSTEIIPSTLQFEEGSAGWTDRQGDSYCDATSDNSSLNVSLLFDETNEASRIPGTFILQNDLNNCKEEGKITTKQIMTEEAQYSTKHETKCEAIVPQVSKGLRNSPQAEDCRFHEPRNNNEFNEYLDEDGNSGNGRKVTEVADKNEKQSIGKEQGLETFTILENAFQTNRKPQESSHMDQPTAGTIKNIFPTASSNVSSTGTNNCRSEKSNKGMTDVQSDEPKRKNIFLKKPFFYPPPQSKNMFDNQKTVLSFSELNKWHMKQELRKTLNNSNIKDLNNTMLHEQKTKQSPKRTLLRKPLFHPPAQDKNMNNNQPAPKPVHSEMELKKMCSNSSGSNEIGDDLPHTQKTENLMKKNLLKESLLHLPKQNNPLTRDSKQEIEFKKNIVITSEQQAHEIKSNENRFQETLLAGHWLRNGLQENTTSKLFPSLNLCSYPETNKQVNDINDNTNPNSSHLKLNNFDEPNQEMGQKLKMEVDKVESLNAEQIRNHVQCINIDVNAPQSSNIIQQNMMGNIMLDQKEMAAWKPRNFSLFSTLTLSDTVPARDQSVDAGYVMTDCRDPTKSPAPNRNLRNMGNPDGNNSAILKENTATATADISKQNKSVLTTENVFTQNNYFRNSLLTGLLVNKPFQPSIISSVFLAGTTSDDTELVRLASNTHQSSDNFTNKDAIQQSKERSYLSCAAGSISKSIDSEALQSHQACEIHQALDYSPAPHQSWSKENIPRGRSHNQPSELPNSSFAPSTSAQDKLLKLKEDAATNENTISINKNLDPIQGAAETKKNNMKSSGAKPRKSGQTKRSSTSKRNKPKAQNEFIHLTQLSETSVFKGSQIQKTNNKKTKTATKKSPSRRSKASTPITGDLQKKFNKENLIMNNSLTRGNSKIPTGSKGQSIIRNVSSNFSETSELKKVLLQPLDIERNSKEQGEPNSMSAIKKNPVRKTTNVPDNVASSAVRGWADLKQDSFNFCNPNLSQMCDSYQTIGVEAERANFNIDFNKSGSSQNNQEKKCEALDYKESGKKGSKVGFIECDNMSWEFPDSIYTHGNLTCSDKTSTTPGEKMIETQAKPCGGNPMEYLSVTQLSWGQSATCGIPPFPPQSCSPMHTIGETQQILQPARSANDRNNMGHGETHVGDIKNTKTIIGIPIEYQTLTQLSWGQSATGQILPAALPSSASRSEIGVNQQSSESSISPKNKGGSVYDKIKNVKTPAVNNDSVFKQPFTQSLTLETNQQLSFTEFLQEICASSTENVLDSVAFTPKKKKTEEKEIDGILNGVEFVCAPQESELIVATEIEKLDNYQTYIWASKNNEIKNVKTQTVDNDSVFKEPFPQSLTLETDQQLYERQDICASSTENVLNSATLMSKKMKTEEEEINEILNGIEFVRVPQESELIVASNIEELINDQTFIW